jgi:endothelin-converting enzyme
MIAPIQDPDVLPERWRTCLGHVDDVLGWTLSRFYIEKAFSKQAKDLGNQIIRDIKDIYIDGFSHQDWMDDSVKKLATDKVNNIDQKVGYPTKVRSLVVRCIFASSN